MRQSATEVSALLKLLAAPNRLLILCHLIEAERSVGELCQLLQMKPPAMSQQLARLRRERLLETRRDGQTVYYAIADDKVAALITFLYQTYCQDADPAQET